MEWPEPPTGLRTYVMLCDATTLLRILKDDKTLMFSPVMSGNVRPASVRADTLVRLSRPSGRWRENEGDR